MKNILKFINRIVQRRCLENCASSVTFWSSRRSPTLKYFGKRTKKDWISHLQKVFLSKHQKLASEYAFSINGANLSMFAMINVTYLIKTDALQELSCYTMMKQLTLIWLLTTSVPYQVRLLLFFNTMLCLIVAIFAVL